MRKSVEQLVFEFTPIKTVAKFVQARWQVLGIQAMIGAANSAKAPYFGFFHASPPFTALGGSTEKRIIQFYDSDQLIL